MKKIALLVLVGFVHIASICAQDVIVKKDGSTILAKVLEVDEANIKYKKFKNPDGPTYTLSIANIQAINYENGETDTFNQSSTTSSTSATTSLSQELSAEYVEKNANMVEEFNGRMPIFKGNPNKKAKGFVAILGLTDESVLETEEIRMDFSIEDYRAGYDGLLVVTLSNKTDDVIFIDLGKSYFIDGTNAVPYYIPSSTSQGKGTSIGGGVNLGAVTGAIGVGGAVGTLASGVNVGTGNSTSNTTTTYAQRIVSIPAKSSITLKGQKTFNRKGGNHSYAYFRSNFIEGNIPFLLKQNMIIEKDYYYSFNFDVLNNGAIVDIPFAKGASFSVEINYSNNEAFSSTRSIRSCFYLRKIIMNEKYDWSDLDLTSNPMIAYISRRTIWYKLAKHTFWD